MSGTLKVLHIVPSISPRYGGPAVTCAALARALGKVGVSASIATTDIATPPQARDRELIDRAELRDLGDLDIHIFRSRSPRRFAYAPELGRFLRQSIRSYDVVHLHSLFLYPHAIAYHAAIRGDVPYVVAPCGALDPYLRRKSRVKKAAVGMIWQRRMMNRAALLHYKTVEEKQLVEDLAFVSDTFILPNGIDFASYVDDLSGDAFRKKHSLPAGAFVVLFLGRLTEKKGLDVLVGAAARARIRDLALVIAGGDDERLRPQLEQIARDAGLRSRMLFVGHLKEQQKRNAYAAADAFVLPSRSENFAQATLEALAAGCACVISTAVNIAADASSAGAAVVVEPIEEDVADALERLANRSIDVTAMRRRARSFAARYDWAAVGPKALEMYKTAIRNGDGMPARGQAR